jgi:hypothetical protein
MTKQNYIVDMKALYECLQFLPQMRVNGDNMVSLNDVLNFLDHFPKTPTNVVLNIVLDEDPFEAPEPLEHPCDNCDVGWATASTAGGKSCREYCEKLAEFWKKAEV